jgi:hypothetical protein
MMYSMFDNKGRWIVWFCYSIIISLVVYVLFPHPMLGNASFFIVFVITMIIGALDINFNNKFKKNRDKFINFNNSQPIKDKDI